MVHGHMNNTHFQCDKEKKERENTMTPRKITIIWIYRS